MRYLPLFLLIIMNPTTAFACSLHDNKTHHDLPNLSTSQQSFSRTILGGFKQYLGLLKKN